MGSLAMKILLFIVLSGLQIMGEEISVHNEDMFINSSTEVVKSYNFSSTEYSIDQSDYHMTENNLPETTPVIYTATSNISLLQTIDNKLQEITETAFQDITVLGLSNVMSSNESSLPKENLKDNNLHDTEKNITLLPVEDIYTNATSQIAIATQTEYENSSEYHLPFISTVVYVTTDPEPNATTEIVVESTPILHDISTVNTNDLDSSSYEKPPISANYEMSVSTEVDKNFKSLSFSSIIPTSKTDISLTSEVHEVIETDNTTTTSLNGIFEKFIVSSSNFDRQLTTSSEAIDITNEKDTTQRNENNMSTLMSTPELENIPTTANDISESYSTPVTQEKRNKKEILQLTSSNITNGSKVNESVYEKQHEKSDNSSEHLLKCLQKQNETHRLLTNKNVSTTEIETSHERNKQQSSVKKFFFKHVTNLTDDQRNNTVVTIQFISSMDIVEWFQSYDTNFRNTISLLLNEKNVSKLQLIEPNDIVYIAPTPIKNNNLISISFMVDLNNRNSTYKRADTIVVMIMNKLKKLGSALQLQPVLVEKGYTNQKTNCHGCDVSPKSSNSNVVYFMAISVLTVAVAVLSAMSLHRLKYRRKFELRKPTRRVWGSERYCRESMYVPGQHLASDMQCTAEEGECISSHSSVLPGQQLNNCGLLPHQSTETVLVHNEDCHQIEMEDQTSNGPAMLEDSV